MTNRKRWTLAAAAAGVLFALVSCVLWSPLLFPAVPPPVYKDVQIGMHIEEVLPLFDEAPHVNDDEKGGPLWLHWYVHDGLIQVSLDRNGFIEYVHFQPSRSSAVEELRDLWRLVNGRR